MNTQETLEGIIKTLETKIRAAEPMRDNEMIAYCLAVIARSMTR
jgi:hypothetical protein